MKPNQLVEKLLNEDELPAGYSWVIRVDGSVSNRPNFYGPFPSHKAADKAVETVGTFDKSGQHSYALDTGAETVDIVTGYAKVKKMIPAEKFSADWEWTKKELRHPYLMAVRAAKGPTKKSEDDLAYPADRAVNNKRRPRSVR